MATQPEDMKFYKMKNPHLIKKHQQRRSSQHHRRATSSTLTKGIAKRKEERATSDCFTMIFIDCDDTLIPSKIHRYLCKNLGIDIFNLYQRTMLLQFQYDIIYAIEAIRDIFDEQYNEEIKLAIVSNASQKWLNHTINNNDDNGNFKLLCDYFIENDIQIKSAIDETFNFLCKKFGDKNKHKVNEMIAMTLNANNPHHSKWMLKYTTYSSIINHYKRKLRKKCRKILNIGDGETELEAIKYYSQTFGVDYMSLKFIKNATFNQLSYQWKYIRNNFWSIISDMDVEHIYNPQCDDIKITQYSSPQTRYKSVVVSTNGNKKQFKHKRNLSNVSDASCNSCTTTESHAHLNVFYFDYVLKNDNNQYFTGNNQLTAIRTYFEKWVRIQTQKSVQNKDSMLKSMCQRIHARMRGNDPYSQQMISFKKILKDALCKNEDFKQSFDDYYNNVRNAIRKNCKNGKTQNITNNKHRKSIDESVVIKHEEKEENIIKTVKKGRLSKTNITLHNKSHSKEYKKHHHRKRSALQIKKLNPNNIKDGSLSLMNLGKSYRRNSATSQGSVTTNSLATTPKSNKSDADHNNLVLQYSDDSDDLYFSHNADADEENSSSPHITTSNHVPPPVFLTKSMKHMTY